MLLPFYLEDCVEAGCDEAGRGCLAGPVVAAAVILPKDFSHPLLKDSKKLKVAHRNQLRKIIETEALAFAVSFVDNHTIDHINILKASILAMHQSLDKLSLKPEHIIVDGNRFYKYKNLPHQTIVKGDDKFASIAAASILAKTYRDEFMEEMHRQYPQYAWNQNMAYATKKHREAIEKHGPCPLHRKSFKLLADTQLRVDL
ncbi:MAG: ribonuclease HII [Chitinophagales bacterium]|nr:ribonuclease HII [Chitinophagales bacterium]